MARLLYVVAAIWFVVCVGCGIATFKSPIYLWHPSQLITRDGVRFIAVRDVLVFESVTTSGKTSLSKNGTTLLSTSIHVGSSSDLRGSPVEDAERLRQCREDKSSSFIGAPRITLWGPDWRNGGGFERASVLVSGGGDSVSVNVFCVPIWFIAIAPIAIATAIGTGVWLARSNTRRLGFSVEYSVFQ